MKASAWMAIFPILGSLAYADSLADAARKERERREKNKAAAEATVIREEDLAAGPRKGAKGTFSSAAGAASNAAPASNVALAAGVAPTPSTETGAGDGPPTGVDATRAAARRRLEESYAAIAETASALVQAAQRYEGCRGPQPTDAHMSTCRQLLLGIGTLAISVGVRMQDADEAARQGWLSPGEVRDARRRYGMEQAYWDQLVALVRRYRR
jgi:hypothetical protein